MRFNLHRDDNGFSQKIPFGEIRIRVGGPELPLLPELVAVDFLCYTLYEPLFQFVVSPTSNGYDSQRRNSPNKLGIADRASATLVRGN